MSLFGDLDPSCEYQLSGKAINGLMSEIGLKPEAVRVALHRLKKDGWVHTEKVGREVIYSFSEFGQAETAKVYPDIYRTTPKFSSAWGMVLHNGDLEEGIRINRNLCLMVQDQFSAGADTLFFELDNRDLPNWLSEAIMPANVLDGVKNLARLAHEFHQASLLDQCLESMAIRLLLLHHWRKLALRDRTWAHIALFPEKAVAECQRSIPQILSNLARPHPDYFIKPHSSFESE